MSPWLLPSDIVVVTGGKLGLGAAIVKNFSQYGCQTISLDLYEQEPKASVDSDMETVSIDDDENPAVAPVHLRCDVRSETDIEHAKSVIYERFQRHPSIVILNAAVRGPIRSVVDSTVDSMESTIDVNLGGVVKCTKAFLPEIMAMKRGFIVTVASALGMIVPKGFCAYGAAKAGVIGFHEGLNFELSDIKDIRTLLVCPGQLDTEMFADVKTPSKVIAPIVSKVKLAQKIFKRVKKGKTQTIYAPLYVRYLPFMRCAPVAMMRAVRKMSNIDGVYDKAVNESEP